MDVFTLPDGRQIGHGVAFVSNDEQFPSNWLALAQAEDLQDRGITKQTVPDPAPVITSGMIAAERERRLALGFDYNFGDARGVHRIGTKKSDLDGWSEVSTYAGALIDSGDITTTIAIVTDTGPCLVTAPEWRAIELKAAEFRQPLWAKSFALMASNPIPADYTNDSHWS